MTKTFCFDLDNTLCHTAGNDYDSCTPILERIKVVNNLYNNGNKIVIFTARGMGTNKGNLSIIYDTLYIKTKQQLISWGINHHILMLGKPSYDELVCDKAYNSDNWFANIFKEYNKGFVAGAFDVIHPGYIEMFKQIKDVCKHVVVGLHVDPSIEGKKLKPVLTFAERSSILLSLKYVDEIIPYNTEQDLYNILTQNSFDVRFLGDDYKSKNFTGKDLSIPIVFLDRSHGWSTTKYKTAIYKQLL